MYLSLFEHNCEKYHEISNLSHVGILVEYSLGKTLTSGEEYLAGILVRMRSTIQVLRLDFRARTACTKIILHRSECRVFAQTCKITNSDYIRREKIRMWRGEIVTNLKEGWRVTPKTPIIFSELALFLSLFLWLCDNNNWLTISIETKRN